MATGDRTINANLGFSNQSLSRVLFAFFLPATELADSQGTRPHRHVSEYCFQLNGSNYPAVKIKAGFAVLDENRSEPLAEIRASTRQSGDFQNASSIQPSRIIDGVGGRQFYEIDLEGLRSGDDGVYSGLYTVGATTSLEVTMNADGANACSLGIWANFQASLTLDTNTDSVFTYSV